ncbi:MAG TPA: sulfatase-like hydrolase/transferase [Pseudolabrys sp.]|nr:sulfatase-like hydrolase/transferase [Pseudolabrys sp.]
MADQSISASSGGPAETCALWRRAAAALRSPNALLLAGGLILPNLLSLVTHTSLVDIGLPPRPGAIILYATLAILARRIPFAVTAALYAGLLCFDLVRTLSLMFGLAPAELVAALDQARRIQFFASPLYLTLIGALALATLAALACLHRRDMLVRANIALLLSGALCVATVDYFSNVSPHYQFGSMFGHDQPVQSAAEVSGFNAVAGARGNNVVVVIVESLGYLTDAAARERIAAPLYDSALARDYAVTEGHTVYYGSTTSGEMRELCNTRAFYSDYVGQYGYSCLPDLLDRRGYTSIAVHGFAGGMFEREQWYPRVGFDRELFGGDLVKTTQRVCGSAFRGACDADLAPAIAAASRQAARGGKPRFIYWLTLNTHIPVAPGEARTDFHCRRDAGGFGAPTVCHMAELWHDVFKAVADIARDPAVGPADILIVGDHAPPLWSRRGRGQFAPGQVAWYRLQPRRDAPAAMREAMSAAPLTP